VSEDVNSMFLRAMNTTQTRRRFLKTTALATAPIGPFLATSGLAAPSERVRID
jgi:hypothetical protein